MQRPCAGKELEQSWNRKEVSMMGVVCKGLGEEASLRIAQGSVDSTFVSSISPPLPPQL